MLIHNIRMLLEKYLVIPKYISQISFRHSQFRFAQESRSLKPAENQQMVLQQKRKPPFVITRDSFQQKKCEFHMLCSYQKNIKLNMPFL